jgi:multidrug efflux pump subunit AcrA (membrane-fusion protein)
MRYAGSLAFAALLALSACGKSTAPAEKKDDADTEAGLSLSADQIRALGIATLPATAANYRQQVSGYGTVVALDAIAQTDSDFLTAQAAAAQSQAAATRAASLATGEDAAVSREVAESAQSKAVADQAALALAGRKAEAAFGMNAPWHDPAARRAIMARLAEGRSVLVRVTFPLGAMGDGTPQSLKITRLGEDAQSWVATTIWDAPADPALPGRGFYALVDAPGLAQNEHVTAVIPVGAGQVGVAVPAKALIYGESEAWVYAQTKPGHFLRVRVDIGKPMGDSYFLPGNSGITAGEPIVVTGSGLLLARETNPSTAAED